MPVSGLRIGSFAGAPIILDSNILILALYVLGSALFDQGVGALPQAVAWLAALFIAVLLHEMGHATVAAALKIPSSRIVLTFFGGYVEFAFPPKARWHEIVVSAAGPLTNLATYGIVLLFANQLLTAPNLVLHFFDDLLFASFVLGAFNLLPGYPLDGGSILRAFLNYFMKRDRARLIAAISGVLIAIAVAVYAAFGQMWWTLMVAAVLGLNAWAEIGRAMAALKAASVQGAAPSTSNA